MRSELKTFITSHPLGNDSGICGAFKTKAEFRDKLIEKFDLKDPTMDKEDKAEVNEQLKNGINENASAEYILIANDNPETLVVVPHLVLSTKYWRHKIESHELSGGKFINHEELKRFNELKETMKKAELYDQLKAKLKKLAVMVGEDDNYLV